MKAVVCSLLIAAFVLPILTVSRAYAGPGSPFPPPPHGFEDRHPLFDRAPQDIWSSGSFDRDRVTDERMFDGWEDRFHDYGDPSPAGNNSGGTSAPLDGGISLLLAAGIGLGLKKAMRKNKSSEEEGTVIPVADDQI